MTLDRVGVGVGVGDPTSTAREYRQDAVLRAENKKRESALARHYSWHVTSAIDKNMRLVVVGLLVVDCCVVRDGIFNVPTNFVRTGNSIGNADPKTLE